MTDYLAGADPERVRRFAAVLTGKIPTCPECGGTLETIARYERMKGQRDAYWGAVQIMRAGIINHWTLAEIGEKLDALYQMTRDYAAEYAAAVRLEADVKAGEP